MMHKPLIAAIFLSQALIQDLRVFHEGAETLERIEYVNQGSVKRVHTLHIRMSDDRAVVVSEDTWYTPKAPVLYYQFWNCPWGQTAQQCVAITSMLQQELLK